MLNGTTDAEARLRDEMIAKVMALPRGEYKTSFEVRRHGANRLNLILTVPHLGAITKTTSHKSPWLIISISTGLMPGDNTVWIRGYPDREIAERRFAFSAAIADLTNALLTQRDLPLRRSVCLVDRGAAIIVASGGSF